MQTNDIFRRVKATKKILLSGWERIPAITKFSLRLKEYNELLMMAGLKRRLPSDLKFLQGKGSPMNRYMKHQLLRLEKLRDKGESRKYWFIVRCMIRNSVSFRVAAINKTIPEWYKKMPMKYFFMVLNKVDKITMKDLDDLEYRRFYVPKANNKMRPIGCPQLSWRIVLNMHSSFMAHFLEKVIIKNQHGFMPGRGCLTAWKMLIKKIRKYKYIYEIDLTNCFNEINSAWVTEKLRELGVPPRYAYYIENLNRNVPKFQEKDEIDETVLRDRKKMHELVRAGMPLNETSIYDEYNKMEPENQKVVREMAREEGMSLDEFLQLQWALLDEHQVTSIGNSHRGMPQGSSLSPILTNLVLNDWIKEQGLDCVFYADDGIFMSDKRIELKSDPDKGILINWEKSGYVKMNGAFIRPLIFLGWRYWKNKIAGHTRKGARQEFSTEMGRIFRLLSVFKPEYKNNFDALLNKTSLGGIIQNKMYAGEWEGKFYESKLTYDGVKNSWLRLKGWTDNYVTTTSKASLSLAMILRNRNRNSRWKEVKIEREKREKREVPKYVFWRRWKK
jgi:hypothetical protein